MQRLAECTRLRDPARQAAVTGGDKSAVAEALSKLEKIMSEDKVQYETIKNLKATRIGESVSGRAFWTVHGAI